MTVIEGDFEAQVWKKFLDQYENNRNILRPREHTAKEANNVRVSRINPEINQ